MHAKIVSRRRLPNCRIAELELESAGGAAPGEDARRYTRVGSDAHAKGSRLLPPLFIGLKAGAPTGVSGITARIVTTPFIMVGFASNFPIPMRRRMPSRLAGW
jgi:hypothetical protein